MHEHGGGIAPMELIGFGLLLAIAVYVIAAGRTTNRGRWPAPRTMSWIAGCFVATLSVQVATARHENFVASVFAHVGLGMLAPLLLALAAPLTLARRSLSAVPARRLSRLLRSLPARFLCHPATAGLLLLGGVWVLYGGGLYAGIHTNGILSVAFHVHIFVSGCLFVMAIAGPDLDPRRAGFRTRAVALGAVIVGNGILARYLFGHPPAGVPRGDAESGSIVLSFGGTTVWIALLVVFCLAWYREAARRRSQALATSSSADELPPTAVTFP